jgi:hypothetical protein
VCQGAQLVLHLLVLHLQATWNVHRALKNLLTRKQAVMDVYLCKNLVGADSSPPGMTKALKQANEAVKIAESAAAARAAGVELQNAKLAGKGPRKAGPKPGPKKRQPGRTEDVAGNGTHAAAGGDEGAAAAATAAADNGTYTMWDLYNMYWLPFGDVLSAMESAGVRVDR